MILKYLKRTFLTLLVVLLATTEIPTCVYAEDVDTPIETVEEVVEQKEESPSFDDEVTIEDQNNDENKKEDETPVLNNEETPTENEEIKEEIKEIEEQKEETIEEAKEEEPVIAPKIMMMGAPMLAAAKSADKYLKVGDEKEYGVNSDFGLDAYYAFKSVTSSDTSVITVEKSGTSKVKLKAVGKGTATVSVYGKIGKYDSTKTLTFDVSRTQVTKPTTPSNVTYDGQSHTFTIADTDQYTTSSVTVTLANKYNIKTTLSNKTKYEWNDGTDTDITHTVYINPAQLPTPTVDKNTFLVGETVDMSEHISFTGIDSSQYSITDGVYKASATTPVGTYSFTVSGNGVNGSGNTGQGNYYGSKVVTWDVVPKKITADDITYTDEFTYDKSSKDPTISITVSGKTLTKGVDYEIVEGSTTSATDAGTYSFSIKGKGDFITDQTDNGAITCEWEIKPAVVTVPTAKTGLVYDGTEQTGINYDTSESSAYKKCSIDNNIVSSTDAGSYNGWFELKDTKNYVWGTTPQSTSSVCVPWSISKKEIDKPTKHTDLIYDGETQTGVDVDTTSTIYEYVEGDYQAKNATSNYSVTLKIKDDKQKNYKWKDTTETQITIDWGISAKKITKPTLSNTSFRFTGGTHSVSDNNYDSTLMNKTTTGTGYATSASAVGTYKVGYSLKDKINYAWADGSTSDFDIQWTISDYTYKREYTIEVNQSTDKIYWANERSNKYDLTNAFESAIALNSTTADIVGIETGKESGAGYYVFKGKKAGTTVIEVAGKSETLYYKVTVKPTTNLAYATVNATNTSFTYDGNSHGPSISVSIDGNALTYGTHYIITNGTSTNAGTYTATINAVAGSGYTGTNSVSYEIKKVDHAVSIGKAKDTLTYDGTSQPLVKVTKNTAGQDVYYFVSKVDYSETGVLKAAAIAVDGWSKTTPSKTDAGTYYVYWYAEGNGNGEEVEIYSGRRVVVTIEKRALDLANTDFTYISNYAGYDETEKNAKDYLVIKYKNSALTSNDITVEDVKKTDAGTYPTTISAVSNSNFKGSISVNFVISGQNNFKLSGGVSTNPTYNGKAQNLITPVSSTYGSAEYKLGNGSWSSSIPTATIPDDYTVYYRVQSGTDSKAITESNTNGNYNALSGSVNVTLKKKDISDKTIEFTQTNSLTFKGYSQIVIYTLKDTDTGNTLTLATNYIATDGSTGKSAGEHTLKTSGTGLYYKGTREDKWNIAPADIDDATITITSLNLTYNGQEQEVKFVVTHNLTDLKLNEDYTIVDNTNKATDAGTYTLKLKGKGDYSEEIITTQYNVAQADIKIGDNPISLTNSAFTANNFTYKGNTGDYSLNLRSDAKTAGFVETDKKVTFENKEVLFRVNEGQWQNTIPKLTDAGIYKIGYKVVTKTDCKSNYKDFGSFIADPIIVTVSPKKLEQSDFSISPSSTDFTGSEITATIKANDTCDAVLGTDYNILNSSNLKKTEPGTYTVIVTTFASNSGNFTNEAFNLTYSWTINKKSIDNTFEVKFNDALYTGNSISAKDYVKEIKFNNITLTSDDYDITDSFTTVGKHAVTIAGKGTRFTGSYQFTDDAKKFEIKQADLDFSATVKTDLTYNANNHDLLSSPKVYLKDTTTEVSGMKVKYSLDGNTWSESIPTSKNAGEYTIKYRVCEGTATNGTYYVGCTGELNTKAKIAPAEITEIVLTGDKEFTYNGLEKSVSFKVKAGTLELASTDYVFEGYCKATNVPSVEKQDGNANYIEDNGFTSGSITDDAYFFKVTGKENGNFTGTKESARWTIHKADISDVTVIQNPIPTYYDSQDHEIDIISVSKGLHLLNKDTEYTVTCTPKANASSSHQATINGVGNYTGNKSVYWTIERANILVNGHKVAHDNQPIEKTKTVFVYNSEEQQLVDLKKDVEIVGAELSPLEDLGTPVPYIEYRLGLTGEWTRDITQMKAKDAGAYTVYYRMTADSNHNNYGDTIPDFVEVIILQAKVTALNFKVTLSGDMIEEDDVSYDPFFNVHTPYNGKTVTATLTGTYTYVDPSDPTKTKDYTLVKGTDYIVYDTALMPSCSSATNAGNYAFYISTIGSKNFEDIGAVVVKKWFIDVATPVLNYKENDRTYDMHYEDLFTLNERTATDIKGPSNIYDYEKTVSFLISDEELEDPTEVTGWNKYDSAKYKEAISKKDAGTYYVYYGASDTPNYYQVTDYFTVTIDKYDISDEAITLTGYSLTEKKTGETYDIQTQTFKIEVDHTRDDDPQQDKTNKTYVEEVIISDSEIGDYIETVDQGVDTQLVGKKSNQGTKTGKYTLAVELSDDHTNYTGSLSKVWGINGVKVDEKEDDQYVGDYVIQNNVVGDDGEIDEEAEPIATIETTNYKILEAVATSEDLSEIANGNKLNIILNSKKIEEETIEEIDTEIKQSISQQVTNCVIGAYIDISLFKEIVEIDGETGEPTGNTSDLIPVHELAPNKYITITVPVDESLINDNNDVNRVYKIVRVHNNGTDDEPNYEYETLDATFDPVAKTLTFSTNKFSYYAVVYKDVAKKQEAPAQAYEDKYVWIDSYNTCIALRYYAGSEDIYLKEVQDATISVVLPKGDKDGYITYTAVFDAYFFLKQTHVVKLTDNYPEFELVSKDHEGKVNLIEGKLKAYTKLVVEDIELDTDELKIDVENIVDIKPINMYLVDKDNNKVVYKNNTYKILLTCPEEYKDADKIYIARVDKNNKTEIIESSYSKTNNTLEFTVDKLGNYVLIASEDIVEIVDIDTPVDEAKHTHIGEIVMLSISLLLALAYILLKNNTLGIISISAGIVFAAIGAFMAKCYVCVVYSVLVLIPSSITYIIMLLRKKKSK